MLHFCINRAGKKLKPERKKILEQSKMELKNCLINNYYSQNA